MSRSDYLVRLRPRDDTRYVSQGRTVLATGRDGLVSGGAEHGLFAYQTRLLSRYRYLVDGEELRPAALSNVEQHSWLGYYITLAPGVDPGPPDQGSGLMQAETEQSLELRVSRYVGAGVHEDLDLTNYTRERLSFLFEIELDADFADQEETVRERLQHGTIGRMWRARGQVRELSFDYRAEHTYARRGEAGSAALHRGVSLRFEQATSPPSFDRERGRVRFRVELAPQGTWHACVNVVPLIDGRRLEPQYDCREFRGVHNELDRRRQIFLEEATRFEVPGADTLAQAVAGALEQAKRDLASLRLGDRDRGERAWMAAAGLPIYTAVYGRDALTSSWQAALASPDLMKGTLPEIAAIQGRTPNDWRDEQPGKMIHEAHAGPLAALGYTPRSRYYGSITTSGFFPVILSELCPQANTPQAWSASAVFSLLQALLGLYPYAPLGLLLVDPHLPVWLPEITLRGLRVGAATVSLRFYRDGSGASGYEVLEKEGGLRVVRQPSPWSLTATWAERLKDALTSLI